MDLQEKKKKQKLITGITLVLLAVMLGYFLYMALVRKSIGPEYPVVICVFLALVWFNSNVFSIIMTKGFEGKTKEQITAYRMFCFLDLVGLAGVAYFVIMMGNNSMMGALIYVGAMVLKKKYLELFKYGTKPEEDSEDEDIIDGTAIIEDVEPEVIEEKETEPVERKTTAQLMAEAEQEKEQ